MARVRNRLLGAAIMFLPLPAVAAPPLSGGAATTSYFDESAYSQPAPNLSLARRGSFFAGNSFFTNAWVAAPASTSARDGLGPLFNTNACQSCHLKDGRGRPPAENEPMTSMLVRISLPHFLSADTQALARTGVVPEPTYGTQIQNRAIPNVRPEMDIAIRWEEVAGEFADGSPYTLRKPVLRIGNGQYGPAHAEARYSARVAPAVFGMGLLEAIPEHDLLQRADPEDADGDGVSGRANRVHDIAANANAMGRFGWKAGQPTVRQQVAAAFSGDLGITSTLYPEEECSEAQVSCRDALDGGAPELADEILDLVTFYTKTLGVPGRRNLMNLSVRSGETLFREIGCTACHVEAYTTGEALEFPELSSQEIHPYTDLLLHDMGDGLADDREEFAANGREWRTSPLWGIGLLTHVSRHSFLLHDGRARNLEEAILWHGGEAAAARHEYVSLSEHQRGQLLFFLNSL
jgi:CxxC motif-containing protein (DUF1111 family)